MSLMKNSNNFFRENYSKYIKKRINIENERSSNYIKTNILHHCLISSKLVARVSFSVSVDTPCFFEEGSLLCILNYLGQEYSVVMEQDGYIINSCICNGDVVDYNFPLFLIKIV